MKKLLLVALLIVGCEETTEPGPDVKDKFLSYPIPKAIVEEWEKVN